MKTHIFASIDVPIELDVKNENLEFLREASNSLCVASTDRLPGFYTRQINSMMETGLSRKDAVQLASFNYSRSIQSRIGAIE